MPNPTTLLGKLLSLINGTDSNEKLKTAVEIVDEYGATAIPTAVTDSVPETAIEEPAPAVDMVEELRKAVTDAMNPLIERMAKLEAEVAKPAAVAVDEVGDWLKAAADGDEAAEAKEEQAVELLEEAEKEEGGEEEAAADCGMTDCSTTDSVPFSKQLISRLREEGVLTLLAEGHSGAVDAKTALDSISRKFIEMTSSPKVARDEATKSLADAIAKASEVIAATDSTDTNGAVVNTDAISRRNAELYRELQANINKGAK